MLYDKTCQEKTDQPDEMVNFSSPVNQRRLATSSGDQSQQELIKKLRQAKQQSLRSVTSTRPMESSINKTPAPISISRHNQAHHAPRRPRVDDPLSGPNNHPIVHDHRVQKREAEEIGDKCPVHPDDCVIMWCTTDSSLVCYRCACFGDHVGHALVDRENVE